MAETYNKFLQFTDDVAAKQHDFSADLFKVALFNSLPVNTTAVFANLTGEVSAGNGYTAGGEDVVNSYAEVAGVVTVSISAPIVWTAAGGTIGPFQYVVLYNDTPTTPAIDPLIAWWTRAAGAVTLQIGETFTFAPTGNDLFTLT